MLRCVSTCNSSALFAINRARRLKSADAKSSPASWIEPVRKTEIRVDPASSEGIPYISSPLFLWLNEYCKLGPMRRFPTTCSTELPFVWHQRQVHSQRPAAIQILTRNVAQRPACHTFDTDGTVCNFDVNSSLFAFSPAVSGNVAIISVWDGRSDAGDGGFVSRAGEMR